MDKYFLLDKILPFGKKIKYLDIISIFQLYICRYGVGKTIAKKIIKMIGSYPETKITNLNYNILNEKIKNLFFYANKEEKLDSMLQSNSLISLKNSVDIYDYRGSKYIRKIPINGQRRRANGKTPRRVRPLI